MKSNVSALILRVWAFFSDEKESPDDPKDPPSHDAFSGLKTLHMPTDFEI